MTNIEDILQGLLDRHTSRKNAQTRGLGEECKCEDCGSVRRAMRLFEGLFKRLNTPGEGF